MSVQPIPERYHSVTPYIVVPDVARQIEFLESAFEARVVERLESPDGSVRHAEVLIGDSIVMLGAPREEAKTGGVVLYLYVVDVDETYRRALAAGAASFQEVTDQFYGDRVGAVDDPFGNQWWISTHVEDVSSEEMQRRMNEMQG